MNPGTIKKVVEIGDAIRRSAELPHGLSVRANEEACIYLKHPLMEKDQKRLLPEVLKSSFCGGFRAKGTISAPMPVWCGILSRNACEGRRKKRT